MSYTSNLTIYPQSPSKSFEVFVNSLFSSILYSKKKKMNMQFCPPYLSFVWLMLWKGQLTQKFLDPQTDSNHSQTSKICLCQMIRILFIMIQLRHEVTDPLIYKINEMPQNDVNETMHK